ncbi:MAG: hypothetical protein HZY74_09145 [Brevundimonas sp.]|nr:MAG: hypothetical protein HZY74_09145 [Brevundimonas sp.]
MKTPLIFSCFATLTLAACASAPTGPVPSGFDASASSFEGWVRISGEEFRLYDTRERMLTGGQVCVSGAMPRNLQRASGDIDGQKVRYSGRTLAWSERSGAQTHNWQGSTLINSCHKDVVILADRVEVLR